jgi:hypothetical protein
MWYLRAESTSRFVGVPQSREEPVDFLEEEGENARTSIPITTDMPCEVRADIS